MPTQEPQPHWHIVIFESHPEIDYIHSKFSTEPFANRRIARRTVQHMLDNAAKTSNGNPVAVRAAARWRDRPRLEEMNIDELTRIHVYECNGECQAEAERVLKEYTERFEQANGITTIAAPVKWEPSE